MFYNISDVYQVIFIIKDESVFTGVSLEKEMFERLLSNEVLTCLDKRKRRNNDALLIELVSNMSNVKRPSVENERGISTDKPKSSESKNLDLMNRLIHFLQSITCLISSVKPEFLLPSTEFL